MPETFSFVEVILKLSLTLNHRLYIKDQESFLYEVYCNWIHPETIKEFAQQLAEQLGVKLKMEQCP